jgi:DNA (cytosine-5)-methyltransferase 1
MKIASLFSGAGGLDLGFKKAGFDVVWANEFDSTIWQTFEANFPDTVLDRRSIVDVPASDIPSVDGIIGGPPCQSWSEAGARRGITDKRGQLFFEYVRILEDKQPKFFLAENVSGILHPQHEEALANIIASFEDAGFVVSWKLLNAKHYEVPEDRQRVIIVGYRKDLGLRYTHPNPMTRSLVLKDAILDLPAASPALEKNKTNGPRLGIPNHEYMVGGFSTIYMSRNRVRTWDEPSFTIQAGGRHAPIHPQAPVMELVEKDVRRFVVGQEDLYRRLSVRECARIQTFPDDFIFHYRDVGDGYKMVGNAVPVQFAFHLARQVLADLSGVANGEPASV